MDDQHLLSSDWRNRSPENADQEYFIDKMRMLKVRLRKYEEENRVLYRCLAEQKSDVKEALRDKCYVINNVQYEMTELKKHILVLLNVLSEDSTGDPSTSNVDANVIPQSLPQIPFEAHDQHVWMSRNKTLEENFKKELKKGKELERQIGLLQESLHEIQRDQEELQEKNAFIEEENNIQREQIALLEDTVRDLEDEAAARRNGADTCESSTQTEVRGDDLGALKSVYVEQIVCLVDKLTELQQQNAELHSKYEESRRSLRALQFDFHERGKVMSALENELNGLKLSDRGCGEWRRRRLSLWEEEDRVNEAVLNLDATVFLSPSSSRSCSSNSSAEFEEDEGGISLMGHSEETRKADVRRFIGNLKDRRRTLHDSYRSNGSSA